MLIPIPPDGAIFKAVRPELVEGRWLYDSIGANWYNMSTERDLRRFRNQPEIKAEERARRAQHLRDLGFTEERIESRSRVRPSLWATEVVDEHINGLNERGFANPQKMLASSPPIFGLSFEYIDSKRNGLRERGFLNPEKMLESHPRLLGYSFEYIDTKRNGLRERGFENPEKVLEFYPTIFGLSFENIDRRLKLYGKLINCYELPFQAPQLMEQIPVLFSAKLDKVMVLVRILREYQVTPPTLNEAIMQRLIQSNLENTLVALSRATPGERIDALIRRTDRVRRERIPQQRKRQIIFTSLPESKIKSRYFKGYPLLQRM